MSTTQISRTIAGRWAQSLRRRGRFGQVAGHVGRLLKLYGEVFPTQIKRRLPDMGSNVHAHLSSMVELGVLARDPADHGRYVASKLIVPEISEQIDLIAAALTGAESEGMPLLAILRHPTLFPFSLTISEATVRDCERLQISYDGSRDAWVWLVEG